MPNRVVDVIHDETGRRSRMTEKSFEVQQQNGWRLVTDADRPQRRRPGQPAAGAAPLVTEQDIADALDGVRSTPSAEAEPHDLTLSEEDRHARR